MSSPRIDPNLRVGRFLLGDCFRALGTWEWFLSNIQTGLAEPMLAEMMAALHQAGIVTLNQHPHRNFFGYERRLYRENLQRPLTRDEAETLLARICSEAELLSQEGGYYTYGRIFLFGSCLHGAELPNDLDLGVEVFGDGKLVPEPSYVPFTRSEFDCAVKPLNVRRPRHVSLHHVNEMLGIGASHKLVWSAQTGRVTDAPIITLTRTTTTTEQWVRKLQSHDAKQAELDQMADRISRMASWPQLPMLDLDGEPDITRQRWKALQENSYVLALAHLRCLPGAELRTEVMRQWREMEHTGDARKVSAAHRWTGAYIKAGLRYNPWTLRANGRLLKRTSR